MFLKNKTKGRKVILKRILIVVGVVVAYIAVQAVIFFGLKYEHSKELLKAKSFETYLGSPAKFYSQEELKKLTQKLIKRLEKREVYFKVENDKFEYSMTNRAAFLEEVRDLLYGNNLDANILESYAFLFPKEKNIYKDKFKTNDIWFKFERVDGVEKIFWRQTDGVKANIIIENTTSNIWEKISKEINDKALRDSIKSIDENTKIMTIE